MSGLFQLNQSKTLLTFTVEDAALTSPPEIRRRFVRGTELVYSTFAPKPDRAIVIKLLHAIQATSLKPQFVEPAQGKSDIEDMNESLSANTIISHYCIVSKIGTGGMGEVYLAQDTVLDRKVAIKFLPPGSIANEEANKRLYREARTAAKLDHPNICSIYEVGEEAGRSFIVMQYIQGETLDVRLKRKPLDLSESLSIANQVGEALEEAHRHGIIHRDIKPSNIIINPTGQAKVMDFGLAKFFRTAVGIDAEAETQGFLTTPGTIIGTVPYMSPEQVHGQPIDARSDIFSFGVVLYEMLTGHQPFAAESGAATIAAILTKEPPSATSYTANCPEKLDQIARTCLEKDRERRYQTMRDVVLDLVNCRLEVEAARASTSQSERVNRSETRSTVQPSELKRHEVLVSRRLLVAGGVLVLIVAAALTYVLGFRLRAPISRSPEIRSLAVLPLKSLDAGENYLGLGIADAVIRRISQTGGLIVRPTSAVRRYLNEDTEGLAAARQLNVDAVLEGTLQRADDRLRVTVNLLRVSDGASLWAQQFDMRMADIFTMQDTTSQQVASGLRLKLDSTQQARLTKSSTSNPIAYEYYLKGLYSFDQRISDPKRQLDLAIESFSKAIDTDPNFALAHAYLAYAYATMAVFVNSTETALAERAKEEINRAEALDSEIAETHLARFQVLFSQYEGYKCEAAAREVLFAQQLNPNIGHGELGFLYIHLGLEDLAERELKRALEIDPTSEFIRQLTLGRYEFAGKPDEWLAAYQKFYPGQPPTSTYLMATGRLEEAQKAIEQESAKRLNDIQLIPKRSLLLALKGDFSSAEATIPSILSKHPTKDPFYHHATYDFACIYALQGKSAEAVKWLRESVASGFEAFPLFQRDAYLNRIRQAPEFIQFLSEIEERHEKYIREFAEEAR